VPNIQKTEGIILTTRPFKESSLIVSLFTRRFGKIKIIAKGCRRPKSKICGALEPFARDEIIFYKREAKDLYTLSDAVVINAYAPIRMSVRKVAAAQTLCEFTDKTSPSEEPDEKTYALLVNFLEVVANAGEPSLKTLAYFYLLRGMGHAGLRPHLADCVRCRVECDGAGEKLNFSLAAGGVVCDRHFDDTVISIRPETIAVLRQAYGNRKVTVTRSALEEIERLVPRYIEYHMDGLTLNSLKHLP
jgi:DNA repair protein RecO (recombination protein O)